MISCCVICFILVILLILSLKEACFISKITKWAIYNYKDPEKPKTVKEVKQFSTKILPRSLSDNKFMKKTRKTERNHVETKIIRINIEKNIENNIEKNIEKNNEKNNEKNTEKIEENKEELTNEKLTNFREKSNVFQRNLMHFPSDSSNNSSSVVPLLNGNDFQGNLLPFSSINSSQNLKKPGLLKLSSLNSSKSSINSEKFMINQRYANNLPKEYMNFNENNEKTLGVVMNQTKEKEVFYEKKEAIYHKNAYLGVKKSLILFKKQMVFMEEKREAYDKSKSSSSYIENLVKKKPTLISP